MIEELGLYTAGYFGEFPVVDEDLCLFSAGEFCEIPQGNIKQFKLQLATAEVNTLGIATAKVNTLGIGSKVISKVCI